MLLTDVNVLVYALRVDVADHSRYKDWLEEMVASESAFAVSEQVLSGFVRVATHPRAFKQPTPLDVALSFADLIRNHANAVTVAPGERHWDIFTRLCRNAGAKGNLVPDAYLAALAIESGSEWITTDRDFARFDGLRWRHPLA
jgi:toxin-antitoxin system PIN domain toxin